MMIWLGVVVLNVSDCEHEGSVDEELMREGSDNSIQI
jgi:hypothetical protein